MKTITIIILILCSISSYGAEPILLKPAKNEVITDRVKINVLMPDSIQIGKPIIVQLILENVSQERITYPLTQILNDFSIYIYYKGQKIKLSNFGWYDKQKKGRDSYKSLIPKHKVKRTIDLTKYWDIHEIGDYKMNVIFRWGQWNREKTTIKDIKFKIIDKNEKP